MLDDSQLDRILAGEKRQKPSEPSQSQNGRRSQDAAADVEEPDAPSAGEQTAESQGSIR